MSHDTDEKLIRQAPKKTDTQIDAGAIEIRGELSRFDLHVVRFMNSEDVLQMSADEVGQYFLLLCQAWLLGKDATLPMDPVALARWARTTQVSPRVMSKFVPVETQWGQRLHSPRLSSEWTAAVARLERYSQRGKLGAAKKAQARADAEPRTKPCADASANAGATSVAEAHGHTKPYQAKPGHFNPNQSSPSSVGHGERADVLTDEKTERRNHYHWARFARVFEIYFGVRPSDGTKNRELYFARCDEFSERGVLGRLVDFGEGHLGQNGGNWEDPSAAGHKFLKDEIADCDDDAISGDLYKSPPENWETFEREVKLLFEKWFSRT